MNWQNDKAVGNDGVIYGTVRYCSINEQYIAESDGVTIAKIQYPAAARSLIETHLLRRLFRHTWNFKNELRCNGILVGVAETNNLGYVGTARIFRPTLNGLKLAMVAEAKRQFLSQL